VPRLADVVSAVDAGENVAQVNSDHVGRRAASGVSAADRAGARAQRRERLGLRTERGVAREVVPQQGMRKRGSLSKRGKASPRGQL
jgi:hypothetical protein